MEPKATIENNQLGIKESWNKPEITVIDIIEDTLGGVTTASADVSNFS